MKDDKMRIEIKSKFWGGFTLVELSLSMAFISILSITVALIISNTIATYHRGVILSQINTVGMEIVDDMRFSIQNSQVNNSCRENDCTFKISRLEDIRKNGREYAGKAPKYGVFCTGSYSYLWNSGYLFGNAYKFDNMNKLEIVYRDASGRESERKEFKLLKILDKKRSACSEGVDIERNNIIRITDDKYEAVNEEPVDLMAGSGGLVLYSLNTNSTFSKTVDNAFYSVSFILGTIQGGINVTSQGDYCKTPGDIANADIEAFDYCAINKFNFAAQANGGLSK